MHNCSELLMHRETRNLTKMDSILSCFTPTTLGLVSLFVISSFLILYWSKVDGKQGLRETPVAKGAWPIIGHLPLLCCSKVPHLTLGAMADKYGPLFIIRIGSVPALVISNWEMAKECFTINDLAVSSRPNIISAEHFSYNQAMLGFAPYGPYWREMRKIITLEFLSNRRIELLSHVRVAQVEISIKELYETWVQKKNDKNQALVNLTQWFNELALNMVLRMIVGKQHIGASPVVDQREVERCKKAIRDFMHLIGVFTLGDAIPSLRWLDLGGYEKAIKETAKELDTIVGEWIREHRQNRALGDVTEDQDFIDVMLSILDGTELAGFDADTINKATVQTLIAGGTDTTSVTLIWALALLLNHPHVLKKAQEELDIQIGKKNVARESDINKLIYIQAIVKETLRLHPAAPLSGPREFIKDCTIGGYHISKGTRLITNLWKIQTDPRIWSDPLEFKPERFLTTHKDIDVGGSHFEYIPFGSGRRMCPGISFAHQMVLFSLVSFLHSFQVSKPSNEPIDMGESFGVTNMKATPLQVFIQPRMHVSQG